MWKAIGWGLAGIPLGFVLGGLLGAVAATVIVTVAGAANWRWHMCEPSSRGVPVRAYAAAGGCVVVVVAAHAALPFLLPVAAALAVVAVALVPVLRWSRRLCVPRSSKFHARYQKIARPAPRVRARRAQARLALPAPRKAIEGPRSLPGVTVTLSAADYVREDRTGR